MWTMVTVIAVLAYATLLAFNQASALVWAMSYTIIAAALGTFAQAGWFSVSLLSLIGVGLWVLAIHPLRRFLISNRIFSLVAAAMPTMSTTEREALEAGTVSYEGDIFSGRPNFDKLLNAPVHALRDDEKAFLEGQLKTLCRMIDDWKITHVDADMPKEVWDYIKSEGFFGMIIPKQYGGLEFSAGVQYRILATLYGRSITLATTVAVPNSLGPGELLLKYGTEDQKNYYLPRLAKGIEIPCFALTGPDAGSDAASIPDKGIVCERDIDGKRVRGVLLNWNKRYITLCPVATVIGLAFRLFDPDNLLGKGFDVGISCALIPSTTPGITKGRRHFPLNSVFMNGPTQGKDVFIPMDMLIGGEPMAGQGWRMLMECLSAGRAVSLPSAALGGSQAAALASSAYARVRRQFNQTISQFEGIMDPLARIAGNAYIMEAALLNTTAAIDAGAKPAVAGAILKYHCTERGQRVAKDAMDIHGGKGICLGPKNYMARGYEASPISITVEGANILTRCLIIFGQGAIRCHPYVYPLLQSITQKDMVAFDKNLFSYIRFFMSNKAQSFVFGFTQARGTKVPNSKLQHYYRRLRKCSANLAFMADFSMIILGANLKRKENLSARLGDLLSLSYLVAMVLKRFHQDGEPDAELPLVKWAVLTLFAEYDQAMQSLIVNIPGWYYRFAARLIVNPLNRTVRVPRDGLSRRIARAMCEHSAIRERVTEYVFHENLENCPLGQLEDTFDSLIKHAELEQKFYKLAKKHSFTGISTLEKIHEAKEQSLITADEAKILLELEKKRQSVIAVDDFDTADLMHQEPAKVKVAKQAAKA